MARKTRVSWTKGKTITIFTYNLIGFSMQYFVDPTFVESPPTMTSTHVATTDSHNPPKKATIHGFLSNTARIRKKKRRDVEGTQRQKRMLVNFKSKKHELTGAAEAELDH